ncbi:hypothetical protein [Mesorhizobium sp. M0130]|uniref:hypothetical protein n=1 Tax=Mesorhizobium sp. M0130 TaxID=2956887 RepID=UPI00333CB60A
MLERVPAGFVSKLLRLRKGPISGFGCDAVPPGSFICNLGYGTGKNLFPAEKARIQPSMRGRNNSNPGRHTPS